MSIGIESAGRTERALCQRQLDALRALEPRITGALITTVDGFDIAANLPPRLSIPKLAAMTSSLLALGDVVSAESGLSACINVVIEGAAGRILLMDIPNQRRKLLLTVLCGNEVTLGSVLWAVKQIVADTGRRLDGGVAPERT